MKTKTPKSIRTLASDLKARRKRKLTDEQIDRLNKIFDEIESYLNSLEKQDIFKGAILDTNILISASYEMRDSHHDVVNIWLISTRALSCPAEQGLKFKRLKAV